MNLDLPNKFSGSSSNLLKALAKRKESYILLLCLLATFVSIVIFTSTLISYHTIQVMKEEIVLRKKEG
jgi:hypothetical protein